MPMRPMSGRPIDEQLINDWKGERLRRALAMLQPGYRVIVVLRDRRAVDARGRHHHRTLRGEPEAAATAPRAADAAGHAGGCMTDAVKP